MNQNSIEVLGDYTLNSMPSRLNGFENLGLILMAWKSAIWLFARKPVQNISLCDRYSKRFVPQMLKIYGTAGPYPSFFCENHCSYLKMRQLL